MTTPFVEKALTELVQEVDKELGFKMTLRLTSSFHLTLATKYRKPNLEMGENIGKVLDETGKYGPALRQYWQQLAEA